MTLRDLLQEAIAMKIAAKDGGKIAAIKLVRAFTGCDLERGKELVELVDSGSFIPERPSYHVQFVLDTWLSKGDIKRRLVNALDIAGLDLKDVMIVHNVPAESQA